MNKKCRQHAVACGYVVRPNLSNYACTMFMHPKPGPSSAVPIHHKEDYFDLKPKDLAHFSFCSGVGDSFATNPFQQNDVVASVALERHENLRAFRDSLPNTPQDLNSTRVCRYRAFGVQRGGCRTRWVYQGSSATASNAPRR